MIDRMKVELPREAECFARAASARSCSMRTARRGRATGESVILVRWETTPDDIHGLIHRGGAHRPRRDDVARGCRRQGNGQAMCRQLRELSIDVRSARRIGQHELRAGDVITVDRGTGRVIVGAVLLVPPSIDTNFETILEWADDMRRLQVQCECRHARGRRQGPRVRCRGIGLVPNRAHVHGRERLPAVRDMIMARDEEERRAALDRLLPMQQADFEGIFEAMAGLP